MIEYILQLNTNAFLLIHELVGISPYVDGAILVIGKYTDIALIIYIGVYILMKRVHASEEPYMSWYDVHERVKTFLWYCITGLLAWVTALILKLLIHMPRPFLALEYIEPLFVYGRYDSFPSGHALVFTALSIVAWKHNRSFGFCVGIISLLIMIARIAAGIHYPIDIMIGMKIGVLVAALSYYVRSKSKAIW